MTTPFPANETERLTALYRYNILDTPPEVAFDRITALAARLFDMPIALVSLVDESRAWFKSCVGFGAREVPRDATLCSFAVLTDDPLIVPDTRKDDRFACNPFVQSEPGVRFYAGAPLLSSDGFNLGTLCLLDYKPRPSLNTEQEATLVDLAAMVVDELELRAAVRKIAQVDAALLEITQGVATVTGEAFFYALVQHFAKVLGVDYVYIGLVEDNDPQMMRTLATCAHGQIVDNFEYPLANTPCWEVIQQRQICCYPREVQAKFPDAHLLKPLGVESYVAIPCCNSSGDVLGLLGVMDGKPLFNVELAESLLTLFALRIATELERQRSEAAVRESEQRMSIAQRCAKAGLWDWNVITNEVYWSPEYYSLYGIKPDIAPAYDTWLASIVEEDRDRVEQQLHTAVSEQQPIHVEFRYLHPERGLCWFVSIGNTLYDAANQPLRATGIALDITDRKSAETELRQKNAILDVLNESAPTPIFVKDRQGRIIYANPATLQVLGKSASEVIGYRDYDLYPHAEDAAKVMENDRRIMESGQTEVVEESPDGIRTFLAMKSPYRNEAGEVIGLIGISNDISDRVQIERDREQVLQQEQAAREAAESANRIKDEFLAVLSHELRSPLNPILGWTRLLLNGKLDKTRQAEALSTIERNAKLQLQLIEDLLDISRIMQGKLTLTAAPVSLAFVISSAIETVRLAAEAKKIQIKIDLDPTVAPISGDATRLQQVMWNLLTNAVKFTPSGGRVTVQLRQIDCLAQIRVIDTGKGIQSQFLPYVFDYFRQEDGSTTRRFGGLGLGLAIARQIVEMHGGTVSVESLGENQGATFTVQLPIISGTSLVPKPTHTRTEGTEVLKDIQILIVDDDNDTREFQAFLLEQHGAKVIAVASGLEALQALDQFMPDVLVSDVGMAEMDGYMLMQQIRSRPPSQGGQIPAIALTAYAAELDQQRAIQSGFMHHITKPVDADALVKMIAQLVQ